MDPSSPSVRLETCGLSIVLLYLFSAEQHHPIEESCREGSLQAMKTENRVISICTSFQ